MQNRIEKAVNFKEISNASIPSPTADTINVFAEWWALKHKINWWEIVQHVWSNVMTSWGSVIPNMIEVTQAQYDALWTPNATTLYIINW